MLTKDLLAVQAVKGRIKPLFIEPNDPGYLAMAAELHAMFATAQSQRIADLNSKFAARFFESRATLPRALFKLQLDRCEFQDDCDLSATRWQWLQFAEELRQRPEPQSIEAYQSRIAEAERIQQLEPISDLYGDLPDQKVVKDVRLYEPAQLLHRYNCALVQGLILNAQNLTIELGATEAASRRYLLRQMRFHRLIAEFRHSQNGGILIRLSGPLSVFQNAQSYGMRLAQFFPCLLLVGPWRMSAEIKYKHKQRSFELSSDCGIQSHYRDRTSYIPEEVKQFLESFNAAQETWRIDPDAEFVHLGGQNISFPDYALRSSQNTTTYGLEIFHRWHHGILLARLSALIAQPTHRLILAIDKSLLRNDEVSAAFSKALELGVKALQFQHYPTNRALLKLLAED